MRIGIDARHLTHPQPGGFRTYTTQLIASMAALVTNRDQLIVYVDRPAAAGVLPSGPAVQVRVVGGTAAGRQMPVREQLLLPRAARQDAVEIFHSPCLTAPLRLPCPLVVTMHDMLWTRWPSDATLRGRATAAYFRHIPRLSAARASAIITVSHSARRDIEAALPWAAERLFVTPEAASAAFHVRDTTFVRERLRRQFGIERGYVFALGSADPRKNVRGLLAAFAGMPEEVRGAMDLVIAWAGRTQEGGSPDTAPRDRVRHLIGVSDDDLVDLYNGSQMFVFPSRAEGFGLPILEAMSCGTPVIAANNSSLPEVAGDAAILIDVDAPGALTGAMTRLFVDAKLRRRLAALGLARAATFSWRRCAQETLGVYCRVLAGGSTAARERR
jgi:glycosyltransferase involved in cell wall biosynthesis